MKRLTSDDTKSIFYDLNLFFAKDNEVWIRGGGPEPDYQDCTLVNWIGRVADKHNLEIYARDAVNLGDEMYDCLQYGIDTIEGVVALLHTAAVQATTMRSRLKEIEDILGDDYDLERLKELVEADREGRCGVLPCPFCGSENIVISNWGLCRVWCQVCLGKSDDQLSQADAIRKWNTRPAPPIGGCAKYRQTDVPCSDFNPKE